MITTDENWIGELPADVQAAVRDRMTLVELAPGEVVKAAGEPATRMHQVERGFVKLVGLHEDGRQALIAVYSRGNCFSETALVARRDYHHTTLALTETRLRALSREDFWALYHAHPEIPEALCRKFAGAISRQMAARANRAEHRLARRIAMMFENLAEHCAETRTTNSATIALPITQTDIGDLFDVTRQSVQREITALKTAGILDKHAGRWIIRDLIQLGRV